MAEMYEEIGDRARQVHYLEQLDALSPLHVTRKENLGKAHLTLGDNDKAEAFFGKVLDQMNRDANGGLSSLSGRIAGILLSTIH